MASKATLSRPYFFIADFYIMKGASDSNDVLTKAIAYHYPTDEQIKDQRLLDSGGIIGAVQFFQHETFRSIPRILYFQKAIVIHEHYGRHSAFLCVPDDRYTVEEAQMYLKHILNLFNMLYGTWNHIQSIYEKDDQVTNFLNEALTPIVNYVLSQHRSLSNLFSMIEYTPLNSDNQKVLLESKHYLVQLKSKYGLIDGFLGYDYRILYSTCDLDTTFYLQLLYQLENELSENLITIPWESGFELRTGVSLFRIYIRRPFISKPTKTKLLPTPSRPIFKITSEPSNMFDDIPSASDDSPPSLSQNHLNRLSVPSFLTVENRLGIVFVTDPSGSSEETGFETDTGDESLPSKFTDPMSSSATSIGENAKDLNTEDSDSSSAESSDDKPLTDQQKLDKIKFEKSKSRSSTISDERDIEKTIGIDRKNSSDGPVQHIHLIQVDSMDTSEDDESFRITQLNFSESTRSRTGTITSNPDINSSEGLRNEVKMTWVNIPDKNLEHEQDELVIYVQENSQMIFVGIFERSLLTDDYLQKLGNSMLIPMANMEAQLKVNSTMNEMIKTATDVEFKFNEITHSVEFDRSREGLRYTCRIPSEESTSMAFFARTELNRNPERKVVGFSRGSHLVSLNRRSPHRLNYSCQRYYETL